MATVQEHQPLNNDKNATANNQTDLESPSSQNKFADAKDKIQKPAIGTSLIIYLILNSVMFFAGVLTIKDCPIKPIIPIYLAVAGNKNIECPRYHFHNGDFV
ncbi:hypothetical protein FQA39_LY02741 [Lamprigera yunnana]|nr:hypothetical protein FQA39_LY02741 [Lamprigera yunnana]